VLNIANRVAALGKTIGHGCQAGQSVPDADTKKPCTYCNASWWMFLLQRVALAHHRVSQCAQVADKLAQAKKEDTVTADDAAEEDVVEEEEEEEADAVAAAAGARKRAPRVRRE